MLLKSNVFKVLCIFSVKKVKIYDFFEIVKIIISKIDLNEKNFGIYCVVLI